MDPPTPAGATPPARSLGDQGTLISNTTNTGDEQLLTGSGQIFYLNLRESTGSAGAVVELYDGSSTGGQRICSINLGTGLSETDSFNDNGLPVERGVFKHMVSGAALVTVGVQLDIGTE